MQSHKERCAYCLTIISFPLFSYIPQYFSTENAPFCSFSYYYSPYFRTNFYATPPLTCLFSIPWKITKLVLLFGLFSTFLVLMYSKLFPLSSYECWMQLVSAATSSSIPLVTNAQNTGMVSGDGSGRTGAQGE